jgi:hypothetical protein
MTLNTVFSVVRPIFETMGEPSPKEALLPENAWHHCWAQSSMLSRVHITQSTMQFVLLGSGENYEEWSP